MRAKIKIGAWSSNPDMNNWLKENAGKFVDIETEHLFTDQYNTDKYRIDDSDISEIENDARQDKGKCKYCGKLMLAGDICLEYGECPEYGIEWFTEKNCFFLAHPTGIEQPDKQIEIKIGSYTLESRHDSDTFRLANYRKTFRFKWDGQRFWRESVGYIGSRHLDIPSDVERKLKLKLNELCMEVPSWRKEYARTQPITAN